MSCPVDAGRSALTGYGRAGTPKDFRSSVDSYAGYLATLLDQLGITRAHIVAHDFGGPWALAWAARHPRRQPPRDRPGIIAQRLRAKHTREDRANRLPTTARRVVAPPLSDAAMTKILTGIYEPDPDRRRSP